jgi:general secretion pathway protein B
MSYILDALRRADAERERGVVPGLHSNTTAADPEPAARDHRPFVYAACGVGAVFVAAVALLLFGPWRGSPAGAPPDVVGQRGPADEGGGARVATTLQRAPGLDNPDVKQALQAPRPAPGGDSRTTARAAPQPAEPLTPPAGAQAEAAGLAAQAAKGRVGAVVADAALTPAATGRESPAARSAPPARAQEQAGTTRTPAPGAVDVSNGVEHYGAPLGTPAAQGQPPVGARGQPPVGGQGQPPAAAPGQGPTPVQATAAAAPAAATAPPVMRFEDLPSALRAAMPRFTVGGAIYSETPSARMLILNGQLYHEGDHPTPDTLVEQIKLKSAVMVYRGTRYEIFF